MDDIFGKNIQILSFKNSLLAERLMSEPDNGIEVVLSKTGEPVPYVDTGSGRKLFVHSRVDPVREAERFISEIDLSGKDLIVVLGFGFGYHCEFLYDRVAPKTNVVVIEKSYALIKKSLLSRNLQKLLNWENFYLAADPNDNLLSDIFKERPSRNVIFITHRGSAQLHPDYYQNITSVIKSQISAKDVNIATLARFEKTWGSNIARNIRVISEACGLNRFFNEFSGIPAIVAAAGPSLIDSIEFIKSNQNRAVIIAVDTSYKLLVENGITPHFCLSADPQLINAKYYEGMQRTETILISDPSVHPSLLRFFNGRICLTGIAFDMMKWIDDICGEKGELAHGGSVSTNAYDFAKRLGASPVLLTGQDLSFTSGLAHAKGSYLDEQMHNKTYRFDNAQMFNRRQLASLPPVYLSGVRGETIRTNQKMMIFKNWFEKRNDNELINATYNGVLINGIKNIPHDKLDFEFPDTEDIISRIDKLYNEFNDERSISKIDKLKNRIDDVIDEIDSLIPVLEKALDYASELSEMIISGRDKSDAGKLTFILKKLADTDKFIESMKKSKGLISFSIQRVIHTITEGYELNNGMDNAGTRSLFLYNGLLEGTCFNRKIFIKMKAMLNAL